MDRFRWCSAQIGSDSTSMLMNDEQLVLEQAGIHLNNNRALFSNGLVKLTTHRLLWFNNDDDGDSGAGDRKCAALPLCAILSFRKDVPRHHKKLNHNSKIILRAINSEALINLLTSLSHLNKFEWMENWLSPSRSNSQVAQYSTEDEIILSFSKGGVTEFEESLNELLKVKMWTLTPAGSDDGINSSTNPTNVPAAFKTYGAGIGAIQREQAAKAAKTDLSISEAFEDLDQLMSRAKEMASLCRNLSKKMKDLKCKDTDEITQLRSTMLSMGVLCDNENDGEQQQQQPTTVDSTQSSSFYVNLVHQLNKLIYPMLTTTATAASTTTTSVTTSDTRGGGCVDLATVYCHINRARGMSLISPDDLLRACEQLEPLNSQLRLRSYPGGLLVLQLASEDESKTIENTARLVELNTSLSVEELSRHIKMSTLLSKGRLLAAEQTGLLCRDESDAGLRFYPNLFRTQNAA